MSQAQPSFGDSSYLDALAVASCVVGALIALVVLRFFVNYLIDVVIIGESGCMSSWMRGICRKMCPCWHRRTQPEESSTDRANVQDVETGTAFRRRPQEERKAIIANILPTKVSQCVFYIIRRKDCRRVTSCLCNNIALPLEKTFSSDDIEGMKQTLRKLDTSSTCDVEDASESGNCVCSICLLEFGKYLEVVEQAVQLF